MSIRLRHLALLPLVLLLAACGEEAQLTVAQGTGPDPELPPPVTTLLPTVNIAPARGWPAGEKPAAAAGLAVNAFATGLDHPRWLYLLPNGDVLVAESNAQPREGGGLIGWITGIVMDRAGAGVPSADRITLLRDADGDGVAEGREVLLSGLTSPFGMALAGDSLYVANTDSLVRFPYRPGATRIDAPAETVIDLPAQPPNIHWTRNVIAAPDGKSLYVTVGSNSNVGENGLDSEEGRAAIWQVDPATGQGRIFAAGLRNPNGLAWIPAGDGAPTLWTTVNERDELGSDLVPDYLTSVRDGAFYGWPYSYFGDHVDSRVTPQDPALVAKAVKPDYALGPHVAALGLAYEAGSGFPAPFGTGAWIGLHGSWNRDPPSGYKVVFLPFEDGRPAGEPVDVLTGFLDGDGDALGRPVGTAFAADGALLVADDVGNTIWRVAPAQKAAMR